ncbi:MAG: response regulator [Acholeplasmatales bacterium]|jgi:putative two-component system response regulator|nr:response regulator [Acholeplasmatales bacterium]
MAKPKMLIVDDIELNRIILSELFLEEYEIIEAENGKDALEFIKLYQNDLSVVLLDLIMPVMNGFEVLTEMNQRKLIKNIPVIIITGENDDENTLRGYALGVSDLVYKPFNPEIVYRRVSNVVDLFDYKRDIERRLAIEIEKVKEQEEKSKKFSEDMIDTLAEVVESRDAESGEHVKRVRTFSKYVLENLSAKYNLSKKEIDLIAQASSLHDIGKIAVPDSILCKPGPLTKEEFEIMKTHTTKGCELLDKVTFSDPEYVKYCYDICRYHHEKFDGRGYPDGIKGDQIPIWSQAVALADVYDALTSKRVYKGAFSHEEAVGMIVRGECGMFNPDIIEVLNNYGNGLFETANKLRSDSEQIRLRKQTN